MSIEAIDLAYIDALYGEVTQPTDTLDLVTTLDLRMIDQAFLDWQEVGRDESGRWGSGGSSTTKAKGDDKPERKGMAKPSQIAAARTIADSKTKAAPKPTPAELAKHEAMVEKARATGGRAGGEGRGNKYDRERSKAKLLKEFGDGKTCPCVHCGLKLDDTTVERDRIWPGNTGGRYIHANLVPSCGPCNGGRNADGGSKKRLALFGET